MMWPCGNATALRAAVVSCTASCANPGHVEDAISVFPTGDMYVGIDEIMAAADRHFTEKDAVWSWTELDRRVDGCRSAVIVYDTTYEIPRFDYVEHSKTVVTYVSSRGVGWSYWTRARRETYER